MKLKSPYEQMEIIKRRKHELKRYDQWGLKQTDHATNRNSCPYEDWYLNAMYEAYPYHTDHRNKLPY